MRSLIPLRYALPEVPVEEIQPFREMLDTLAEAARDHYGDEGVADHEAMFTSLSEMCESLYTRLNAGDSFDVWDLFELFQEGDMLLKVYWHEADYREMLAPETIRSLNALAFAAMHPLYWAVALGRTASETNERSEESESREVMKERALVQHLEQLSSPMYLPDEPLREIRMILDLLVAHNTGIELTKLERLLFKLTQGQFASISMLQTLLEECVLLTIQLAFEFAKRERFASIGLVVLVYRHLLAHLETQLWQTRTRVERERLEQACHMTPALDNTLTSSPSFYSDCAETVGQIAWDTPSVFVCPTSVLSHTIAFMVQPVWARCEALLDEMILFREPRSQQATQQLKGDATAILKSTLTPFEQSQLLHHVMGRWRVVVLAHNLHATDRLVALLTQELAALLVVVLSQAPIDFK